MRMRRGPRLATRQAQGWGVTRRSPAVPLCKVIATDEAEVRKLIPAPTNQLPATSYQRMITFPWPLLAPLVKVAGTTLMLEPPPPPLPISPWPLPPPPPYKPPPPPPPVVPLLDPPLPPSIGAPSSPA